MCHNREPFAPPFRLRNSRASQRACTGGLIIDCAAPMTLPKNNQPLA
jgi:hypothetical protein